MQLPKPVVNAELGEPLLKALCLAGVREVHIDYFILLF